MQTKKIAAAIMIAAVLTGGCGRISDSDLLKAENKALKAQINLATEQAENAKKQATQLAADAAQSPQQKPARAEAENKALKVQINPATEQAENAKKQAAQLAADAAQSPQQKPARAEAENKALKVQINPATEQAENAKKQAAQLAADAAQSPQQKPARAETDTPPYFIGVDASAFSTTDGWGTPEYFIRIRRLSGRGVATVKERLSDIREAIKGLTQRLDSLDKEMRAIHESAIKRAKREIEETLQAELDAEFAALTPEDRKRVINTDREKLCEPRQPEHQRLCNLYEAAEKKRRRIARNHSNDSLLSETERERVANLEVEIKDIKAREASFRKTENELEAVISARVFGRSGLVQLAVYEGDQIHLALWEDDVFADDLVTQIKLFVDREVLARRAVSVGNIKLLFYPPSE